MIQKFTMKKTLPRVQSYHIYKISEISASRTHILREVLRRHSFKKQNLFFKIGQSFVHITRQWST